MGVSIFAASVDPLEKAQEVAENLSFTVAFGVDRSIGEMLGSFWDERRGFMQPTEFVLNKAGRILSSTYSSSPVGRTDPQEALVMLEFASAAAKKNK